MKKYILLILGILCVFIATVGVFIPLLPTTPFLLLASYLFLKSSDKAYNWLLNNKIYGKYISDYINNKGIPLKIKIYALILLWVSIIYSVFFCIESIYLRILLIIILISVSIHIFLIKTKE